jgi:hypothetical protein
MRFVVASWSFESRLLCRYETLSSLQKHLLAFVTAYDFAKHLKALRWRTPFQAICDAWQRDPSAFKINPHHLIPGPHT